NNRLILLGFFLTVHGVLQERSVVPYRQSSIRGRWMERGAAGCGRKVGIPDVASLIRAAFAYTSSIRRCRPTACAARARVPSVTDSFSGSRRRSSCARPVLLRVGSPVSE